MSKQLKEGGTDYKRIDEEAQVGFLSEQASRIEQRVKQEPIRERALF